MRSSGVNGTAPCNNCVNVAAKMMNDGKRKMEEGSAVLDRLRDRAGKG
jgi:hypothetical protein